jgi:SAM-dependent methyltransferase
MMFSEPWITSGDFIEIAIKLQQRGLPFLLSKFSLNPEDRTKSAFQPEFEHANWWIIPDIQKRLNFLATGNPNQNYEAYLTEKYFLNKKGVLISPGCGVGGHERKIALANPTLQVTGFDLTPDLIKPALYETAQLGIPNLHFEIASIYTKKYQPNSIDYFLFHASLHHFDNIESLLLQTLLPALKPGGLIIIHEYTGPDRMLFPKHQIQAAERALKTLPKELRIILNTAWEKRKIYAHGKLRMLISDPSECVQSSTIRPLLHKHLNVLEEKSLGGNILMPVLKHIAHHFVLHHTDHLENLIRLEDEYLKNYPSDFTFGVYKLK